MKNPRLVRSFFAVLLVASALAACSSPPPRPGYPDIRFTGAPPIRLNIGSVDLRENYKPPMAAPNVDHLYPVTPIHALESWAHDRLAPTGGTNRAVFTIEDASAIETSLPPTQGIKGWFTTDQSERYDMTVVATLTLYNASGTTLVSATAKATRFQSVAEDITPNQRDQVWYDMTKAVMEDFDRQMNVNIDKNFGGFIR